MATLYTYSTYLSMSDLLSFIISNFDKHKFSSIWNWISSCNDVMNHVDCIIKCDVYPQKMHLHSKISVVNQKKYIMGDIAWIIAKLKDDCP